MNDVALMSALNDDRSRSQDGVTQEEVNPCPQSTLTLVETGGNGAYVILVPGIADRQWNHKEKWRQCQTWLSNIGLWSEHRVWVYQYDLETDSPRIFSRAGIHSEALRLLDCLKECCKEEAGETRKRIVFVMLDIGGILVKEALTIASLNPLRYDNLDSRTSTLIFANCPHRAQKVEHYEDLVSELLSSNHPYPSGSLMKVQSLASSIQEINDAFLDTKMLVRALVCNLVCRMIGCPIEQEHAAATENPNLDSDWDEEEEEEKDEHLNMEEEGTHHKSFTDEHHRTENPSKHVNRHLAYYGTPYEQTYISRVSHYELTHGVSGFSSSLLEEIREVINDSLKEGLKMEHALLMQSQAPPAYPRGPGFPDIWLTAWAKRILECQTYKDWSKQTGLAVLHLHGTSHVTEISQVLTQQLNHVEGRDNPRPAETGEVLYFEFNRRDARFNNIHAMLSFFVSALYRRLGHINPEECSNTLERCISHRGWSTEDLFIALVVIHERGRSSHQTLMVSRFNECDESRDWFLHRLAALHMCDYGRVAWIITSETHPEMRAEVPRWTTINLDTLTDDDPSLGEQSSCSEMTSLEQLPAPSVRDILICVQHAMRPLTVRELAVMISLERNHRGNGENYVQRVQTALNAAKPVIYTDNNEVYLGKALLPCNLVEPKTTHAELAQRCLSLLQDKAVQSVMKEFCCSYSTLDQPSIFPPRHDLTAYAVTYWFCHYRLAGEERPSQQALDFFSHPPTRNAWHEAYNTLSNPLTRLSRCYVSSLPLICMLGLDDLLGEVLQTESNSLGFHADCGLALCEAAQHGHVSTVNLLMKTVRIDHQILRSAISHAASNGSDSTLHDLVVHASKIDGFTWPPQLLCRVAMLGLHNTVKFLLDAGMSTNPPNAFQKRCPLHLACIYGHSETVKVLLAAHADLRCTSIYGRTPLHAAAIHGDPEIITLLLKAGSEIEALDEYKQTPLQLGMLWGRTEGTEILLKAGADPNYGDDTQLLRPLLHCCRSRYWEGVRLLLDHDVDINCKFGVISPLYMAVCAGNVDVARMLLEKGADPDENPVGWDFLSLKALYLGDKSIEMIKLLLDHGARIEEEDNSDSRQRTLLSRAAGLENIEMVKYLLERGADVNHCGTDSSYPVYEAVWSGQLAITRVLVDAGADINCVQPANNWRPVIAAYDDPKILQYLLDMGADVNAISNDGTCLHQAVIYNMVETVKLLLKHQPRPDLEIPCPASQGPDADDGYTALGLACGKNNTRLVRMLIEAGANKDHMSRLRKRPLDICVQSGCQKAAEVLLEYRYPVSYADDEGNTVLHYISNSTPRTLVRQLVNAGADLLASNKNGVTPLQMAVASNNLAVAKYLLFKNADPNQCGGDEPSLIHIACDNNELHMVQALVKAGADVQQADSIKGGISLLTALIDSSDERETDMQLLRYLVEECKVDVNRYGGNMGSALVYACCFGDIPQTQYLLECGANPDVADPGGRRPIHLASNEEIVDILLTSKAETIVNGRPVCDNMGRTPIHFAAAAGGWTLFEKISRLYDASALNQPDKAGWTPLFWALMNGAVDVELVKHLLDNGADIWARVRGHKSEFSPLKLARYCGVSDEICELLTPDPAVRVVEGENKEERWDEEFHLSRRAAKTDLWCDSCWVDICGIAYTCRNCNKGSYDLCFRCFMSRNTFHNFHSEDDWDKKGPEYDDGATIATSSTDSDSVPDTELDNADGIDDDTGTMSVDLEDVSSDSESSQDDASQGTIVDIDEN